MTGTPDIDIARARSFGAAAADYRFGLAVMLELAQTAAEHRQPLRIDY